MFPMPTQIEIYEEMSALSRQMVEAAHAHDWERLIGLEKSVAALRTKLPVDDDNAALAPGQLTRKRELIQGILENDAEVRTCTEPWMEQLRQFLDGRGKRTRQAYSAKP
jgi:flagellar protein FliT